MRPISPPKLVTETTDHYLIAPHHLDKQPSLIMASEHGNGDLNGVRMDDLELEASGYTRAMPRQFSRWSLGALAFTLTCTWLGTGSSIGIALTEASSAGTLWALPIAGCMTMIVAAGMAELASAYPIAGAQYYWSFMVASDKYKPFASFL